MNTIITITNNLKINITTMGIFVGTLNIIIIIILIIGIIEDVKDSCEYWGKLYIQEIPIFIIIMLIIFFVLSVMMIIMDL